MRKVVEYQRALLALQRGGPRLVERQTPLLLYLRVDKIDETISGTRKHVGNFKRMLGTKFPKKAGILQLLPLVGPVSTLSTLNTVQAQCSLGSMLIYIGVGV